MVAKATAQPTRSGIIFAIVLANTAKCDLPKSAGVPIMQQTVTGGAAVNRFWGQKLLPISARKQKHPKTVRPKPSAPHTFAARNLLARVQKFLTSSRWRTAA